MQDTPPTAPPPAPKQQLFQSMLADVLKTSAPKSAPAAPSSPFVNLLGLKQQPKSLSLQLKSVPKPRLFENIPKDWTEDEKNAPNKRMRLIDTLRYHKPTEEERKELNLTGATERLCLHSLNDILAICGARKGFRFKSSEIERMRSCERNLQRQYETLNSFFQSLPFEVCKYRFTNGIRVPVNSVEESALRFHTLVANYVKEFEVLQELVTEVRKAQEDDDGDYSVPPIDNEPKSKHRFPLYLVILIKKYCLECHGKEWDPSSRPLAILDSIAKLSIHLGAILFSRNPLIESELQSMENLLQIIKCPFIKQDSRIVVPLTQRRVTKLIWEFLCTVRELKSVPKEKKYFQKQKRSTSILINPYQA